MMSFEEAIKILQSDKPDNYSDFFQFAKDEYMAKLLAIKSLKAWKKVKQDLYKFASDSFDAECAECYRIALRCIEGHLKEVDNEIRLGD